MVVHLFWLLHHKRGYPKFVTFRELLADKTLGRSLGKEKPSDELLRIGLASALSRGILLHQALKQEDGKRIDAFFLNTNTNKEAIARLRRGELVLGDSSPVDEPYIEEEKPNIYTLYEQNIGVLTPMITAELGEAEKLYPERWIEDAFREAMTANKRQWRYISRILERWSTEGKDDGESRRDSKEKPDSDKYIRGKYGHLVQR